MKQVLALLAAAPLVLAACQTTGSSAPKNAAPLTVTFANTTWNGSVIPNGQQCSKFSGKGATPALTVTGVPEAAAEIIVEYNDESYAPLSYDGGHGKIGYIATSGTTQIPSVPGESNRMPDGARIVAGNRATGSYAAAGYLPPCSGGNSNQYSADVKAVDANGTVLAFGKISLGRY